MEPTSSPPGGEKRRSPTPRRRGGASSSRPKFQCHLCASTFSRKDNLKTHQRLHSGEMPFQCKYCGRKFRWQSSARTHEQVHERHGHSPRPDLAAAAAAADAARRATAKGARSPTSAPATAVKVENAVAVLPPFCTPLPTAPPLTSPPQHPTSEPTAYPLPRVPTTTAHPLEPRGYHMPTSTTLPALTTTSLPTLPAEAYQGAIGGVPPPPPPPAARIFSSAGPSYNVPAPPLPVQRAYSLGSIERSGPPPLTRVLSAPHAQTGLDHSTRGAAARRGRGGSVERGGIRKPRAGQSGAPPRLMLDFEDVIGDVGAALQTSIAEQSAATPQQTHGESPMFGMPEMSQQDIERCLDRLPRRNDDTTGQ